MKGALLLAALSLTPLAARADGAFEGLGNNALGTQVENQLKDGRNSTIVVRIGSGQAIELTPLNASPFSVQMAPPVKTPDQPLKTAVELAPKPVKVKKKGHRHHRPRAVDQLKRLSEKKSWSR
jgi:hypothetical protein